MQSILFLFISLIFFVISFIVNITAIPYTHLKSHVSSNLDKPQSNAASKLDNKDSLNDQLQPPKSIQAEPQKNYLYCFDNTSHHTLIPVVEQPAPSVINRKNINCDELSVRTTQSFNQYNSIVNSMSPEKLQENFSLPVFGDGNCFYRSIARFIYKTQSFHHKVRQDLATFYSNLSDKDKKTTYSVKNLSIENHIKKLLGNLQNDNGWGGIDECPLVAAAYKRIVVVKNQISGVKIFSFNVFLPNLTERVLYFPISKPSFKEISDSLERNASTSLGMKEDIIFISFSSSGKGELLKGCHFETFWPI